MQGIYCIENKLNRKRYVGSATNFYKRKKEHLRRLGLSNHHSVALQRAWIKYGAQNFIFVLLEPVEDRQKLIEREQWWLDNTPSEYNICKIAGSSLGLKRRPETIEKIRVANVGLKHPQWRNVIKSKAQGGDNHWTKKKKFSEESRKKMSESQKTLFKNGYKHPLSKPVIKYTINGDFIEEFINAIEAAKLTKGANPIGIGKCCRGLQPSHKNFIWKFKIKQNEDLL